MEFLVTTTNDADVAEIAGLAGLTMAQWIQARVLEHCENCKAQARNIRAKEVEEKVSLYKTLDSKDKQTVDAVFDKALAAKQAEMVAAEPVEEEVEGK